MSDQLNWLVNDSISKSEWLELISICSTPSAFQHPDFYTFLRETKSSTYALAMQRNGKLVACVVVFIQGDSGMKSFFSRRGIIFGGPIFIETSDGAKILNKLSEDLSNRVIYLESRNLFDYSQLASQGLSQRWKFQPWKNFIVETGDSKSAFKALSESRRRQIKKATKLGVTYGVSKSDQDLRDLYDILQSLYLKKIKKPLLPFTFFEHLVKQDWVKMIVVYFEGKVIGGIFCPFLENYTIYEWYICGLDEQYKDCYPSVIATWAAIEVGGQLNCKFFDFMGAGPSSEAYGVREFKARFGGLELEPGRWLFICNKTLYSLGKLVLKIYASYKK